MNGLSFFHLISQMATVALILVKYLYFTIIEPVPAKYLKYKSLENFHLCGTRFARPLHIV